MERSHFVVLLVEGPFEIVFGSLGRVEAGAEGVQALRCVLAVGSDSAAPLSFPPARSGHQVDAAGDRSVVQLQGVGVLQQRADFHARQTAFGARQQRLVVAELVGFFLLVVVGGHGALFEAIVDAVVVNADIIEIVAHIDIVVFVIDVLFLVDGFALDLHIEGFPCHPEIGIVIAIFLSNQVIHIETDDLAHAVGTEALGVVEGVVIRSYFVIESGVQRLVRDDALLVEVQPFGLVGRRRVREAAEHVYLR